LFNFFTVSMKEIYGVWNQVFWVIFIGLGVISILLSKFNIFILGLFVGLVIIVIGIQKITEERNFRYLHFKQRETDKKLEEVSYFLDRTYEKVDSREETEHKKLVPEKSLEKTKEEIYDVIDKLAKKMLQIENKVNQISRSVVDNWDRPQEDRLIETSKPKTRSKTSKRILDSNNDLKDKLKKAMGG